MLFVWQNEYINETLLDIKNGIIALHTVIILTLFYYTSTHNIKYINNTDIVVYYKNIFHIT